eukprot:362824-Chlamydomonas_euryale.AAC.8
MWRDRALAAPCPVVAGTWDPRSFGWTPSRPATSVLTSQLAGWQWFVVTKNCTKWPSLCDSAQPAVLLPPLCLAVLHTGMHFVRSLPVTLTPIFVTWPCARSNDAVPGLVMHDWSGLWTATLPCPFNPACNIRPTDSSACVPMCMCLQMSLVISANGRPSLQACREAVGSCPGPTQ